MLQPTTPPSAPVATPAAPAPATAQPAAPTANISRSDGVVGGNAPAATGTQGTTLQPSGGGTQAATQPQGPGSGTMLLMIMMPVVLIVVWFMGSRADKKRRAEHAATLAGLQRNDKVQTIGGVLGTVAEINDNEVILKTDEITNTRIRVVRSAISTVLNRSTKPDGTKIEPVKTGA